jgi:hypothetical protein
LVIYAVISVLPATLLYGLAGGDMLSIALLLTLCVLAGLSIALLPRYFAMLAGFMPALHNATASTLPIPGPSDPRFLTWAPIAAALLIVICVLRWRKLMNHVGPHTNGFSDAMVLQFRRSGLANSWSSTGGLDCTQQVRQRPDWMQPQADLHNAGPQHPRMALRIALGGWYLPKTFRGHVQAWAPTLVVMLIPATVIALTYSRTHVLVAVLWQTFVMFAIGWGALFGSLGVMIVSVMLLGQRWRRVNTELPLLALLPGLGDAAASKTQLLRTTLTRPLRVQAALLVSVVALSIYAHLPPASLLLLVISQLGCAAALLACVLATLGGRPIPGWGLTTLMTVLATLVGAISFLPGSLVGDQPWTPATTFVVAILSAWLVMGVVLAWLGRRGWQGWRARPHAFLANV